MKTRMIEHIDARIRILQEARACVGRAQGMGAIANCHEQERRKTKVLRKQAR
jgi:hypothetical protein